MTAALNVRRSKAVPGGRCCSGCGARDGLTVSLYAGLRCPECPPSFDPTTAVEIARRGLGIGTARAYIRSTA